MFCGPRMLPHEGHVGFLGVLYVTLKFWHMQQVVDHLYGLFLTAIFDQ